VCVAGQESCSACPAVQAGPQWTEFQTFTMLRRVGRARMGSMANARAVAEQFFERFGAGDIDGAFALFSPDCISLTPSGPVDNEKHHAAAQALKHALPDSSMELLRVLELGDEVYVTGRFQGTHDGDLATPIGTLAASGKTLDLLFVDYFRVVDGQIVECEAVRDRLDMILQLDGIARQ